MGVKKRLCKYILEDRPLKLKSYVSSHDIDLDDVKLHRGQNVLHFCASFGSRDMLRCLLRFDCDVAASDKDGNLPLHLALLRALSCTEAEAENILDTIVKPLEQAFPLGQDVENRQGDTAHDLTVLLKEKIKKGKRTTEQKQREEERLSQEEDEKWRQKLAEESVFEYEDQLPRYSADDDNFFHGHGAQSFDRWSEMIREESSRKRRHQSHTFWRDKKAKYQENQGASSSKHKSSVDEEAEKLKQAREEMRKSFKPLPPEKSVSSLVMKKQRYEKKFTQLLNSLSGTTLTFACVAWPHVDLNCVASVLFCDIPDKGSEAYRKYLRSQQVRWHPDKFTQKFGEHLHPDHIPKIMARVKAISQLLNKLESERSK